MGCDLSGLDLHASGLRGANLVAADLSDAVLRDADLTGANLERASLIGVKLHGANLDGVNLWRANLRNAQGLDQVRSLEYTNFFRTEGLSRSDREWIGRSNTTDLPDYGSFVDFFQTTGGVSMDEIRRVFTWLDHGYFRSMFGRRL
ncbi:hypothetical protein CMK11_08015 [Candidatus Poribacteria bacterium]|nr:hypothetical protein [Candidatus Poribacteria bacterium]